MDIELALAASRARLAVMDLTIEDARKAKALIEAELTTWKPSRPDTDRHPYADRKVCDLTAIVGAPGVATWLAHFHTEGYLHLPDVVFEINEQDHVALATQFKFMDYQFQQEPPATQEGGEA